MRSNLLSVKVLVTGAGGLLGTEVVSELVRRGHEPIPTRHGDLDIAEPESVARIAAEEFGRFDWCINCAAYTAVDRAESEEQLATEVNGFGVGYLSYTTGVIEARLLHVSTDFVFDGCAEEAYPEDAPLNPLGAYGRSKLAGELALQGNPRAIVVRTSWLFGPNGPCFPRTILRALAEGKNLRVVADQYGTPTYTPHLARVLVALIERDPFPGVYHASGQEIVSWHQFASLVVETCTGKASEIEAITTSEWPTAAKRPQFSALSNRKLFELGIPPMPPLKSAVEEFCAKFSEQVQSQ